VKEVEMDGACSTKGETRTSFTILTENQKERDHYEILDIGKWIIFKWFLER
jgi:hypothetical protein